MSDLERLRHTFRPTRVTTLFVGESPPNGGTFFYKRDSQLYWAMKEALSATFDFLTSFQADGFFLDDLVLHPINQIKIGKERDEHRRNGVSLLAERMTDYKPLAVVAVMCAIEPMVKDAIRKAGLSRVPLYVTPFPSRPEHKRRFQAKMAEIIPKLPKLSKGT
jgi:hypothetical protein